MRLIGDIDEDTADRTVSSLLALDVTEGPINLLLSTTGGDWYAGMAIYETIAAMQNYVTVTGVSYVMSMGTVIMQAADKRLLTPQATFLLHYGTDRMSGTHVDFQRAAKHGQAIQRQQEDIYLERIHEAHPRYARAKIQKLLEHDTYLTAQEAVALGLATKVTG